MGAARVQRDAQLRAPAARAAGAEGALCSAFSVCRCSRWALFFLCASAPGGKMLLAWVILGSRLCGERLWKQCHAKFDGTGGTSALGTCCGAPAAKPVQRGVRVASA
eukprot:1146540-Pelagomonas_calceolata.AAC.7